MHYNLSYSNIILIAKILSNLKFSATVKPDITSLLYQNRTASAVIWTVNKRCIFGHAISTLASNS